MGKETWDDIWDIERETDMQRDMYIDIERERYIGIEVECEWHGNGGRAGNGTSAVRIPIRAFLLIITILILYILFRILKPLSSRKLFSN